jgi:peptide/nickel transport system permease protein
MRRKLSLSGWIGLVMLGVFIMLGIIGPWIAPHSPSAIDLRNRFAHSTGDHWLGTDRNGVDILSQLLWGARKALRISFVVVAISSCIGVAIGTVAGYFRGIVDDILMRIVDILMAFPGILLNIAVVATVAKPGLGVLIFALCLNGWVGYARVVRAQVMSLRERDFVVAAKAMGASNTRIMWKHLIPNSMAPVLVQMTFGLGGVIAVEASLAFLGIGAQLDYTWGAMLEQGTSHLWKQGFGIRYAMYGGLSIMWVVLGANLLGDGLRDWFDPKRRGR